MIKIWSIKQMSMVHGLVADGRIPKVVADEALRVVSILDEYYGESRNVDNDDGGYVVIYTDYIGDKGEIAKFLDRYHVQLDDAELDDILCTDDGSKWREVLYLVTNDFGITIFYSCRNESK